MRGYFATLVDNFEWPRATTVRFGLYACDPGRRSHEATQRHLYGEICAANALTADMVRRYAPEDAEDLFPGVEVQQEVTLRPRDQGA